MNFDGTKGHNISSSSLVALKAELLNKQNQAKQTLSDGSRTIKRLKTKPKAAIQNKGVTSRAQQDELNREDNEEPSLEKSKLALQEKAKLYEKLSKDKNLLEEDTISEEQSYFLVNFQQKVIDKTVTDRRMGKLKSKLEDDTPPADEKDYEASNSDEEWVDYLDSFGRTRRCIKKDLHLYKQQDAQIQEKSYANFVKSNEENTDETQPSNPSLESAFNDEAIKARRLQWEQEEAENVKKSKLHYQDVLYQEARQHGVGFYSFSKDEEERSRQMQELEKTRKETESIRSQSAQTSSLKQAALNQRLMKVRQRKRQKLGLPPLDEKAFLAVLPEKTVEPPIEVKEEIEERSTKPRPLPQSVKIRPWDLGKEGVSKKPVMTQSSWVEKNREERVSDFAPPSSYYKDNSKKSAAPVKHEPVISEDSIMAGLAFMKTQTLPSPSAVAEETYVEEEDLLPPGENADTFPRWTPRKTEIPPPTSMDYYSSSIKRHSSSRQTNLAESFSMGIQAAEEKRKPGRNSSQL